jgi:HK97 family phage portal protein
MGILSSVWQPAPRADVTWQPLDDRWYAPGMALYSDGPIVISAESILRCGPVLAAVRFRGDAWAMCPPSTYIIRGERRVVDSEHYSHRVLRNPNAWQTGNRWRHVNGVWLATWGNAYNEIVAGPGSFADELRPMFPAHVDIVDQRADGTLVYRYRRPGSDEMLLGQERVLHFRDIGTDGIRGLPMYNLIRNAVSIALAAEQHTNTFLKKGARAAGFVEAPPGATKEQRDELRDAISLALSGPNQTGSFGIVPGGVKVTPVASTNKDGQLLELSDAQVGAILRFLGVPGVVAGYADKTATYASAKEFFESGGIKHCVLPILTNVEAEEEKALLMVGDGRQIKHNLDALLRANWKDRMEGLTKAAGGPIISVNEARDIEDYDAIADPRFDRPHIPSNMEGATQQQADPGEPVAPPEPRRNMRPAPDDDERARSKGWQFALDAAGRVVRREVSAMRDRAPLAARDVAGWRTWVVGYYERHAAHVAEVLHVEEAQARQYAEGQRDAVLAGGLAACEAWEETVPYRLAALAYGEE